MGIKQLIYADNAATTMLDPLALEAMLPFLTETYSNPSSIHMFGKQARIAIENARQQIADCIGASPEEILFTSSGTESDNWAIKGTAYLHRRNGVHLISSSIEHHAVLKSLYALEGEGFHISLLPVDTNGIVSSDDLITSISPDTTLISIIMANNEIGTVQDIGKLAAIARHRSILFHTDAVQAIGHIPVKVTDLGIDLLSASAHKFHGPKGVGFLYKRSGIKLPEIFNGGNQEFGVRAGTENVAGIVGMACALKNNIASLDASCMYVERLISIITSKVCASIPGIKINGHPTQHLPGLASLSIPGVSGESILHLLDMKGIYISTGAACNSKDTIVSHVLQAIRLPQTLSNGTLRISVSKNNTEEDAVIIADTIINLYHKLH